MGQILKEQLPAVEVVGVDLKTVSKENLLQLRDLCKNNVPDVIIVNGLDKETVGGFLVPLLMEWNCANELAKNSITS